ncbi:pH-response regulator protein palH/RIM21 [Sphaceloma murrayae]|uniref:pH-response regulator protein palH/RIM21 n=1 Tax=Sphaceloma murrayae TaxID=2082308 RepID=A0A2K1QW55_9PEZI|nr:pH-response regulator protein palH/RIM21 [Sphaceloma murrayae]
MQPTPTRLHERRQLWNLPTYTSERPNQYCTPITLAANGILSFAADNIVTLTREVVFQPLCTDASGAPTNRSPRPSPFYASATPQVYVVAAATVLAWVLVIMLVISPRTFMNNLSSGPSPFSVGRGIIGGANGGTPSSVGIGSRPWLQKAAALTVAISLTIATADTFIVSEKHYPAGIDGNSMRALVENSLEIRITRNISDIFVWLAQVQTLIRLFPRHKEKVLIKWIGFALIVLDTAFSCLNSFLVNGYRRPRDFVDAIPALTYLFELALSLLYAAWVIYYAFTKRRYAFYHPKMRTVTLISGLSLVAILTPVVFFVIDITFPDIAGWGDYFRWVGAAAASVIVWEWVERIEILERDEKKDGILGREIFDGDEMLDMHPTEEMTYNARRNDSYFPKGRGGASGGTSSGGTSHKFSFNLSSRFARSRAGKPTPPNLAHSRSLSSGMGKYSGSTTELKDLEKEDFGPGPLPRMRPQQPRPTPPPPAVSPPSRTDTTSAASTVYVVRHDGAQGAQPVRRRLITPDNAVHDVHLNQDQPDDDRDGAVQYEATAKSRKGPSSGWHGVSNPFKRKRTTPPAEVRAAMRASQDTTQAQGASTGHGLSLGKKPAFELRSRLGGMSSRTPSKGKGKSTAKPSIEDLPWTVIPVQPQGTAWSPSPVNGESNGSGGANGNGAISDGTTVFGSSSNDSPPSTASHRQGAQSPEAQKPSLPPKDPPRDTSQQSTADRSHAEPSTADGD